MSENTLQSSLTRSQRIIQRFSWVNIKHWVCYPLVILLTASLTSAVFIVGIPWYDGFTDEAAVAADELTSFMAGQYGAADEDCCEKASVASQKTAQSKPAAKVPLNSMQKMYAVVKPEVCQPKGITTGCWDHFAENYVPGNVKRTKRGMRRSIDTFLKNYRTATTVKKTNRRSSGIPVEESRGSWNPNSRRG